MTPIIATADLFKIADCFESPKGIVIAGANPKLDTMAHDALQKLLKGIRSISIVGLGRQLTNLEVQEFSFTTSVGNQRNIFLLLKQDVPKDSIPSDGVVFVLNACENNDVLI